MHLAKITSLFFLSIFFLLPLTATANLCKRTADYTQYVNAFIGNADNGHTFPGACVPFGLVQASPETGHGSWRYCSGYNYEDDYIEGFAQTHLNGTGIGDLGDVFMYPFCQNDTTTVFKSKYNKTTHKAIAGYYFVSLTDAKVDVELTATARTAFHRYHFKSKNPCILLDLQRGVMNSVRSMPQRVVEDEMSMVDNKTIVGRQKVRGWVPRQLFYVIKFDCPFTSTELPIKEGEKAKRLLLSFENTKTIQVKVAMSTVSVEGALAGMAAENPGWNFDAVNKKAKKDWNILLGRTEMVGSNEEKTNFYTSLYHLFIQPNNIADIDGKYRGADDRVYVSSVGQYYSTLSLWDTYRAAHPLYTLLTPERVDGMVQTMLSHHKVQDYLPIWTLWGKENHCMIGNHAIPVIVDAYLKGFNGFDVEEAYAAIKKSSMRSHEKSNWELYNKHGYYPFDLVKEESVSRTLESAYDDYCVAQMAQTLGKIEDYKYFMRRANFYKNLFDPATKLMRGKDSDGNWRTPFSPFHLSHAGSSGGDYTEGNAWQYSWHVQHDIPALIELMGGNAAFVTKLDSLFVINHREQQTGFVGDVSGLIGQYAHGNEPSHHVIYMYNFAHRPDRTQELVREVFDRFYKPKPDGLCGNDDCGQMSAWYVFSAMGFYPVNPAGGEYIIGAPQIQEITLHLPNNKSFKMIAKNLSRENKYVQSLSFRGKTITNFRLHHKDIVQGGELIFEMTNKPNDKRI